MGRSWNANSKLFLALQYILQGTLYGLQLQYLPIMLRKSGSSLLGVGSLHLLTFPWLLKPLWAPLIDVYSNSTVWLSLSYSGIAAALFTATVNSGPALAFSLVLLNFCSATTDLTLSKIIMTDFRKDELSKGSSLQIIGYKVGVLFGGGLTLLLSDYFSFTREIFLPLAIVYILLTLTCCVAYHSVTSETEPHDPEGILGHTISDKRYFSEPAPLGKNKIDSGSEFMRIDGFAHAPGIKWMMTCACVYKFASHSSQSILTMFLVDRGESMTRIGFMAGIAGQSISITVASVCGVVLAGKWTTAVGLFTFSSAISVFSVLLQLSVVSSGSASVAGIPLVYVLHNVVHGSQATPVYTLMLGCSQGAPRSLRATVFSFLGTLEIFGKQLSLFLAGALAEFFGYVAGMVISLTVSILVVGLVQACPNELKRNSVTHIR